MLHFKAGKREIPGSCFRNSARYCIFVCEFSMQQTMKFTHFHVHSQYSILDGAASIPGLIEKAKADGQAALALTDHGNIRHVEQHLQQLREDQRHTEQEDVFV